MNDNVFYVIILYFWTYLSCKRCFVFYFILYCFILIFYLLVKRFFVDLSMKARQFEFFLQQHKGSRRSISNDMMTFRQVLYIAHRQAVVLKHRADFLKKSHATELTHIICAASCLERYYLPIAVRGGVSL